MNVAFIGLGIMGGPMARHLAAAGHQLTVFNRTRARELPLLELGARSAASPAEAVAGADSVHLCLLNQHIVRDIVFDGSVLAAMRPGQILIDHGTSGVAVSQELDRAARDRGVLFLDAPVSGGVEGAEAASLAIMVGGDRVAFNRVQPLLDLMGGTVRHVGAAGSGQALKLANQLLVIVQQLAAAEAFAFATKAGVDGQVLADVLPNAWGRSFMLERSLPNFLAGDHPAGRASWETLRKDGNLLAESARNLGQRIDLTTAALALTEELFARNLPTSDLTACLQLYQDG